MTEVRVTTLYLTEEEAQDIVEALTKAKRRATAIGDRTTERSLSRVIDKLHSAWICSETIQDIIQI